MTFSVKHKDGRFYLSSPQLPLFHVVGSDIPEVLLITSQLLPEYIKRNMEIFKK